MMTVSLLLLLLTHITASSSDYGLQPLPAGQQTSIISGTVACASCPNDGIRDCVGRTLERDYCLTCVTGRTSWPCNLLQECHCSDGSEKSNNMKENSSSFTYPILGSNNNMVPLSSSTVGVAALAPPLRQGSGLIGSEACANCSENSCVATNPMSIGDAHCAQCAKGQVWWPCNLMDECYCKSSSSTTTETMPAAAEAATTVAERAEAITTAVVATTVAPPISSPTMEKLSDSITTTGSENNINQPEQQGVAISQQPQLNIVSPTIAATVASTTTNNEEYYYDDDKENRLDGMHVIDAHIAANKIALVREIFTPPSSYSSSHGRNSRGRGSRIETDNDFTYHGFRSAFHTAITSSLMFGNETNLYVGEMYSENGRAYGLVNIAAFLAMSASDSIYRGGCDEVNVDVPSLASNACGQGGMNYQEEMSCPNEESMYDCPLDVNMIMNAGPVVGSFIGDDDRMTPRPFYCGPPKPGGVDEGVEG